MMAFQLVIKALVVWFGILFLAVLNGWVRETVLSPVVGMDVAQLLSGATLSALILIATYITLPWVGAHRTSQCVAMGLGWLTLTLLFEFSFGLFQGKSWQTMLDAYRFEDGNIWPLVLIVTLLAPLIAAKFRRSISPRF